jgi:hypothetical protein
MKVHFVAFVAVGLAVIGISSADVSHLTSSNYAPNSLNPNDDQDYVSINFDKNIASAGNNQQQNKYWWMNTKTFSNSNLQQHQHDRSQSDIRNVLGSHSQHNTQHTLHNTPQNYQQHHQQPRQDQQLNTYAHMTSLSGSPSEVNSLMADEHNSQSNKTSMLRSNSSLRA